MTTHRYRLLWGCLAMIIVSFSACLSPHENLYTLDAAAPAPPPAENRAITIVVGPVTLPQVVDRPQLVVREGDYKVAVLEQERWATPLKESLPRLLADELSQRLPQRRFVPASSRAITASVGQVIIDISRFDVTRDQGARIIAHWMYRLHDSTGAQAAPLEGDSDVQTKTTQAGYEGLVQALQRASVALADDIAAHLATTHS